MTRTRFQPILQNLHFSNNNNDHKTDKAYKINPVIKHLNNVFAESLSNSLFQSAEEHMRKFKIRSSMKQYIKNKPIKWGFKYCYRCDSETGYVYHLELCQRRNGGSWLDGSAEVGIPTWSRIEVSILSPFVFWSARCCSCQFFYIV